MNPLQLAQQINRRLFLRSSGMSLGAIALGSLLDRDVRGAGLDIAPAATARAETGRRVPAPAACRTSRPRSSG